MSQVLMFPLNKAVNSEVRSGERIFKFLEFISPRVKGNRALLTKNDYQELAKELDINSAHPEKMIRRIANALSRLNILKKDKNIIRLSYSLNESIDKYKKITGKEVLKENIVNILLHELERDDILKTVYLICEDSDIKKLSKSEIALIAMEIEDKSGLSINQCKKVVKDYRKGMHRFSQLRKSSKFDNYRNYADTLINYFVVTGCFYETYHHEKAIAINEREEKRILFFINSEYKERTGLLKTKTFNKELYEDSNILPIKKNTFKNINNILEDETKVESALEEYAETRTNNWETFEYYNTLSIINQFYKNDPKTPTYDKQGAIKLDINGDPKKASLSGKSDCSIRFNKMMINIESTLLTRDYDQMTKEYFPIMDHMEKDLENNNCRKGLVLFVAPKISENFLLLTNQFNKVGNLKGFFVLPLNIKQYDKFIEKYNTADKLEDLYERLAVRRFTVDTEYDRI